MDKISITLFLESLGPTFYFEIIGRQREDQKSVGGEKTESTWVYSGGVVGPTLIVNCWPCDWGRRWGPLVCNLVLELDDVEGEDWLRQRFYFANCHAQTHPHHAAICWCNAFVRGLKVFFFLFARGLGMKGRNVNTTREGCKCKIRTIYSRRFYYKELRKSRNNEDFTFVLLVNAFSILEK